MGIYAEQVLPRLIDVLLGTREFDTMREEVCADLYGDVLEIGSGSGRNFRFLPASVAGLWTIEPSRVGNVLAADRFGASSIPVVPSGTDAQRLRFDDARFDSAVSTATLCTIPDAAAALAELRRVLKPDAWFHFAEHGHSPDRRVAWWQDRCTPLQRRVAGGCHINRDIIGLITDAGFAVEKLRNFYLKGPKACGYMYVGRARNPAPYTGESRRADRVAEGARLLSE